tara:strand:+ start:5845 stop:6198 length:354 start_codon:yes stop_codon:yes gene_type:complete
MKFPCKVHTPMYDCNEKKYIRFFIPDGVKQRIHRTQSRYQLKELHKDDPLEGNVLTVKIPYKYKRVACTFEGAPVQSLEKGDDVDVIIEYMGMWTHGDYCGYAWKLTYIKSITKYIV